MRKLITITSAAVLTAGVCLADIHLEQKTQFHIAGAAGAIVNVFSRTAREGATSTTVVRGDRKLTRTNDSGEIIDLGEEKVYTIDFAGKTYTVKTFADLRREYEERKERARKAAEKRTDTPAKNEGPEYEVDFAVKSTGNKETINGFNTHEEVVTVTVHEKGKKIDQSGGWILTSDMWMGPKIANMREIYEFDRRFAAKIYGTNFGEATQQLAMAMAATPAFGKAMKVFSDKRSNFEGSAIRTNMKFETVAGTDPSTHPQQETASSTPTSVSGAITGGLFRKMKERREQKKVEEGQAPNHDSLFDSTTEILRASSSATSDEVAIPAGFKQR